MTMKTLYQDELSAWSLESKKNVLELAEQLIKRAETTKTGELIHFEVADWREDGFYERVFIGKLEEWELLVVEDTNKEFGHPFISISSLDKLRKFRNTLNDSTLENKTVNKIDGLNIDDLPEEVVIAIQWALR